MCAAVTTALRLIDQPEVDVRISRLFCRDALTAGDYPARVDVIRYDDVYTAYFQSSGDESAPEESLSYGITGAAGVFAGGSAVEIPVTLVVRAPF